MYKKILLASAIAAASAGAQAATWGTAAVGGISAAVYTKAPIHTKEGIVNYTAAAGVQLGTAPLVLGASYAVNDEITFTYNVDKATGYNFPTSFRSWANDGTVKTDVKIDDSSNFSNVSAITVDDGTTDGQSDIIVGDTFTAADATGATAGSTFTVTGTGGVAGAITVTPNITILDNKVLVWGSTTGRYIDFGLTSSTASSATYRVTGVQAVSGTKTSTVGGQIYAPAMLVKPTSLAAAGVATVSFSAKTATGTAMDALATAYTVGSAIGQYNVTVDQKLDAVVDVEQARKALVGGTPTASTDVLGFTLTAGTGVDGVKGALDTSGALTSAAVTTRVGSSDKVTHTINGDFAFVDNSLTTAGITSTTALSCDGTTTVEAVATTGLAVSVVDTGIETIDCTFTKDQAAGVIPNQAFSGTSKKQWTSNAIATGTTTDTWASLGAWTLNGASITAYGVPMGSAVSRFLWVNNKGTDAAVATYTAVMNGSSYGPYALGTIPGKTSMSVGGLIDTDLGARGIYIAPSSRANITVDAPVKSADVTMSASYKHNADKDRLAIETSDSVDGTAK
jgi:hypothetical protein